MIKKSTIVVLGSPNAEDGTLYHVALERCNLSIELYNLTPNSMFILTGGFGEHFNKAAKSHAFYLKEYLLKSGIHEDEILSLVESSNTIEDAYKAMEVIEKNEIHFVKVVTSDFHLNRAKYIFSEVFKNQSMVLEFFGAKTNNSESQLDLDALVSHEKWALERLKSGGLEGYYKK